MCTGILTLTHFCKFHTKIISDISMYFYHAYICRTDTLTSWSKEGIITEVLANSTTVRCLSNHLSSFAVIAEDTTIKDPTTEYPTLATNTTATSATTAITSTTITHNTITTDLPTSMKVTNMYC